MKSPFLILITPTEVEILKCNVSNKSKLKSIKLTLQLQLNKRTKYENFKLINTLNII